MKKTVSIFVLTLCVSPALFAQKGSKKVAEQQYIEAVNIKVGKELQQFPQHTDGTTYTIYLCADVPRNSRPSQVAYHQQTGHVFLIFQVIGPLGSDTTSQVFGFYPKRGLPTLVFKSIKSVIKDNSRREYDVYVKKDVDRTMFDSAVNVAISEAARIYHINKYNCYDYALKVFNTLTPHNTVPSTHVRFPFIFGRGGSPVGLYQDLYKLKDLKDWSGDIAFGNFKAPMSSTRVIRTRKK